MIAYRDVITVLRLSESDSFTYSLIDEVKLNLGWRSNHLVPLRKGLLSDQITESYPKAAGIGKR